MKWLLDLVLGGAVEKFTGPLERAYQAKLTAQNSEQRIEADKAISFFEGQIALARTAAESDRWWSPRSLMGWCATAYVFKIVVWDTVLGLGVTPNPGSQVTGIVMTIIGFYYGSRAVSEIGSRVLTAFAGKR